VSTPSFVTQLDWPQVAGHLMGAGTVLLAVGFSVPQLVHMRRRRSAAGVSLPAVLNSAISFLAWTVYAASIGDAWLIASSAVGLPGAAVTAVVAWRCGASVSGLWLPAAWVVTLVATAASDLAGTTSLFGIVVGASITWLVLPAVVKAWLSRDVSGLAASAWWVLASEGALFLGYGLVRTVPASTVYGVICLLGSFGVLSRLSLHRRGRRSPAPPQESVPGWTPAGSLQPSRRTRRRLVPAGRRGPAEHRPPRAPAREHGLPVARARRSVPGERRPARAARRPPGRQAGARARAR
jgi:uncharacterized protein with PQ loop repeat